MPPRCSRPRLSGISSVWTIFIGFFPLPGRRTAERNQDKPSPAEYSVRARFGSPEIRSMLISLRLLATTIVLAAPCPACLRPGLSQPHGQDRRLRAAGRRRRHRRARGRRPAGEAVGAGLRGGEPARRRRQSRCRDGGAGRARRLHAPGRAAGAADHQCGALQEAQFRSGRVRAARNHDIDPEHAGGAAGFSGRLGGGARRLCQGQPGQGQFRLAGGRHHAPPHRRIVRPPHRHGSHPRALSRHRAGGERPRSPAMSISCSSRSTRCARSTRPGRRRCWR